MPTNKSDPAPTEEQKQQRLPVSIEIGKHVLRTLGQPPGQHRVLVRQLWTDHYRVNVFVGLDASSAKVAHSYFLVADSDGNVITSDPAITKRY